MRKAFSLIEVLVVIGIISIVFLSLKGLPSILLRDISRFNRTIEANTSMCHMLARLHRDVSSANGLPASFGRYTTNNELLLIDSADGTLCYQLKDEKILRYKLTAAGQKSDTNVATWSVPNGKVQWQLWQENGRGYAVAVKTYIEQNILGHHVEKKMSNTHLYFAGTRQESIE